MTGVPDFTGEKSMTPAVSASWRNSGLRLPIGLLNLP